MRGAVNRTLMALWITIALFSCTNLSQRAAQLAHRGGLVASVTQGTQYRHQIFTSRGPPNGLLYVFIEGDGSPWLRDGTRITDNPTPRRPLALELVTRTPHSVMYLGRPCYFSVRVDAACTPDVWTSGRYSGAVVESMATAVNHYAAVGGYTQVVLIGYSGGGALAVLMAPHIQSTRAVITIGANLDIAAWTQWHGYLPLGGSLDPASQPPLGNSVRQWHLVGGRDMNVPESLSRRYLNRLNPEQVWRFPEFDHVCCWVEQWPRILARLDAAISDRSLP
jgi:hypothetical protein